MLRACRIRLTRRWWKEGSPDFTRANRRRAELERKRTETSRYLPPVEPTPQDAVLLYRRLLKRANEQLIVTDKEYFRRKVRQEFEVTARLTSARVRGIMFEKGTWMAEHNLGGIV